MGLYFRYVLRVNKNCEFCKWLIDHKTKLYIFFLRKTKTWMHVGGVYLRPNIHSKQILPGLERN